MIKSRELGYWNTLQGINISHLGKRKIIFKYAIWGGYVNPLEGNRFSEEITSQLKILLYSLDFFGIVLTCFLLTFVVQFGKRRRKRKQYCSFGESSNGSGSGLWVFDEYATTTW